VVQVLNNKLCKLFIHRVISKTANIW